VGWTVGQLLKNVYGCTVIVSAGSDEKVRHAAVVSRSVLIQGVDRA
jgi:NADPH-dependent curcumin reductase CurA